MDIWCLLLHIMMHRIKMEGAYSEYMVRCARYMFQDGCISMYIVADRGRCCGPGVLTNAGCCGPDMRKK